MSASPIGADHGSSLVIAPFRGLAAKSDKRLVELAQRGDKQAVEVLYDRYATAILRYCRSLLRSTQEAEDVQQEVFVQALSALRDGAGPESFRPWLYRVAHNACISHMRAKRPTLTAVDGEAVAAAATTEPASDEREELRQLLDDLSALPPVQRGALLLREMDGFSYEQVGEVLGLPVTTVRSTIFRARSTLQGLAEARDAKCTEIQAELSRLADRRGRRSRRITSHLKVCGDCREFRDGLRERPVILRGVVPFVPIAGVEGAEALMAEGAGLAVAGGVGASSGFGLLGGGGAGKLIAAAASTCALVGGAGTQIGVLGGGSGAAVDADPVTIASEPATAGADRLGESRRASSPMHGSAAYRTGPVSYAAPGTVVWRPSKGGGAETTGRDGHRLALGYRTATVSGSRTLHSGVNHQWSHAMPAAPYPALAGESGFAVRDDDDSDPIVRRHSRESRSEERSDGGRERSGDDSPRADSESGSSTPQRSESGSGESRTTSEQPAPRPESGTAERGDSTSAPSSTSQTQATPPESAPTAVSESGPGGTTTSSSPATESAPTGTSTSPPATTTEPAPTEPAAAAPSAPAPTATEPSSQPTTQDPAPPAP